MPAKVRIAARTHRACSRSCAGACRPAGRGLRLRREPRRVGEPERVPRAAACARSTRRGVARALWIGTPYFSRCRAGSPAARSRSTRGSAGSTREQLARRASEADPAWRFVFLDRRTDPVVLFSGLDLIWRRPDWLPPGRWTPGVTFVALAFDLFAATNWTSTVPQALAHDYRLEGPLAVDLAFGHHAGRERVARAGRPARGRGGRAQREIARAAARDPAILRAIEYAFPDCATPRLTARRTPIS